ncbi:MAG: integral membrane sensor signal transduction histidine kinase [Bacteroidetes bacterium]|nr:MAG: integral membrane sensor signal transduction histidine kinase [Bacteroidota bacterium]
MNLYSRKKRWKIVLATIALIIISASIYYTNDLVNQFANEERNQVRTWADAVERRASLMKYQEEFFVALRKQERDRVELLAKTYQKVLYGSLEEEFTFYLEIISNNTSIPVLIVDQNGNILERQNVDKRYESQTVFDGELKESFSAYSPIPISDTRQLLYYRESIIFSELKRVLDDLVSSFLIDIASNASSVPVIITDSTGSNVLQFGNLNVAGDEDSLFWQEQIALMRSENTPIEITFLDQGKTLIFYKSSPLLLKMQFFPLMQILIIALFLLIAYLLFSYARKAEQNQVWAGMAKETAHQIGTPLSSLIAWIELLKMEDSNFEGIREMEKDVERLETITERFSKIGSTPVLENADLIKLLEETVEYLRPRTSKKISYTLQAPLQERIILPMNEALFQWVIENLCKNAIDAMNGQGKIVIAVKTEGNQVIIDISDTGKGIAKSELTAVFKPGYTSKKRGWGLGLTLAKRIINDYHKGKIFVRSSVLNEGTTFRIVLKKKGG